MHRVVLGERGLAASCQRPDPQPQLSGSPVPPVAHQAGRSEAITAMAHRLARLVHRMLKYGQRYVDKGTDYYEQRYRNQQLHLLRKNAAKLGLHIMEAHP
jgi:hypothetical protein